MSAMQTLDRKKFVLYYKPTFPGGEDVKIIEGIHFFTENKGFTHSYIDAISKLQILDSFNIASLIIWRVK